MCDPAIALACSDGLDDLRRKFVGRGALPWLTSELFAIGAGGGQPGFHPLADQVTFELCDRYAAASAARASGTLSSR
jgi:hypothetical protein